MARRQGARGFSLIELMITVAIVGILAAVAYPSYVGQVRKGKRAECRAGLFQAMQQQERYFTQYNQYTNSTTLIKSFSGDTPAKSACALTSTVTNSSQTLVITASPTQAGDPVTAITLDNSGAKGCTVSGTTYSGSNVPKDCWP